jgi:hypothetical protein
MAREENGKIESTHLGPEDHGIPTWWLMLTFRGSGQGFGGYDLRVYGTGILMKILSVVGVEKWENLPNRHLRVRRNNEGLIVAIGHIVEDRWLDMDEEREAVDARDKQKEVTHGA